MMGSPKNSLGRYFPSIPSFYKTEEVFPHPQTKATSPIPDPFKPGDGFTEEELANATDPLSRQWDPDREYEELSIDQLIPGPKAVTFMGRVVNFSTRLGSNPTQPKATGWHWLVVKDDSAAISVSPDEAVPGVVLLSSLCVARDGDTDCLARRSSCSSPRKRTRLHWASW
jgi:hypothetical protein